MVISVVLLRFAQEVDGEPAVDVGGVGSDA